MKKSTKAVMLGAVATAHAQSYTTSTFIECTPTAAGGTITSYATMTSTVCDLCEHMSTTMVGGMPVHVTAYTTVYTNACPTGLVPVTYTITESCTGMTPTFTGPDNTNAGYMPPGFTTTTLDCGCDKETPGPQAMTFPITQGPYVPAQATPAPVAPANGGSSPVAGSGGNSPAAGSSGSTPAASSGSQGSSPAAGSGSEGSSPAGAPSPNAAPAGNSGSSPASYGESSPVGSFGSSPAGDSSPAEGSSPVSSSAGSSDAAPADGSGSSPVASGAATPNSNAGGNSTITPFNPNSASKSVAAGFLAIICAMAGGMIML